MKSIFLYRSRLAVIGLLWALVQSAAAQNFTMNLEPNSLTLVPGQTASFVLYLTPLNGFATNVTLSTGTLPQGVTAAFSPNPVTPPNTSLLTLTATTNVTTGSFTLNVTGIGGGITNTTSSSVTVNFGLLPLCTGGFTGEVTDMQTGLPVPGATVQASYNNTYSTLANTNGIYNFTNVALAANNVAADYSLQASATGYWYSAYDAAYAVCDATNVVNLQIVHEQYGSISGTVTIQGGGVAAGVTVSVDTSTYKTTVTDSNGNYQVTGLGLNYTNAPVTCSVSAQPAGYWQINTNGVVQANSNTVVNFMLVPICYSTVTGSVVYADTLLPAAGANLYLYGGNGPVSASANASGNYTLSNVSLSFDNGTLITYVEASANNYYTTTTNVTISTCGSTVVAPVIYLQPVPHNNYSAVTGHVYDLQTSLPLAGAYVDGSVITDANGAYLYTNILIGSGTTTNISTGVYATDTGYFESYSNIVLYSGLTTTQDLYLLKMGHGYVMGTARDSATTLPLTNIYISISGLGSVLTDTNGHYFSGPISLNSGNVPTYESIYSSPLGYYGFSTNTTVTNGVTNIVDLSIIKVCTGATIIGNVVNALTQQPITNATVYVSGFASEMTDSNGNFILTNITVGNDNSPIQTTINASAPGFNPQSHTVTIFCNATITTEFGAPQTAFGIVQGYVTNVVTGLPLVGAFIGSQFGEAAMTDTNGFYQLTQAPLGANNSSRTWTVTAIPTNFTAQTLSVTVSSNVVSTLNFGFGQPPAHLLVTETSTPNPVAVGSNLVYYITLSNSAAPAANVQLTDQLAPTLTFVSTSLTNPPGVSFTTPVFSNGVITTTATNLGSNQSVVLVVTVIPTVTGALTNITIASSSTPDTDPTGTNLTAMVINTATAPATPHADLGITITALPNPVLVSNQFAYSLLLTNAGPSSASAVVLNDVLPTNTTFISASNSQGSFTQTGATLQWNLGTIANQGQANVSFIITPLVVGSVTNSATVAIGPAGAPVTDTNQANNTASVVVTVDAPVIVPLTNVTVQVIAAIAFNPQTGLYQQTVQFDNLSGLTATGVRISVLGLPANVTLYNATGTTNGVPYVEYDQSILPNGIVDFVLEYYNTSRSSFVSTNFVATAVAAVLPTVPVGTTVQMDANYPLLHNGQVLLEFPSSPGQTYVILYSSNVDTWIPAVPPIVAPGTRVQWIDSGPPKTISAPGSIGQRFYRVLQTSGSQTNYN